VSITSRSESRRLRFFLQEFRVLEGLVGLGAGASLSSLLASRKSYISLTDARWSGSQRPLPHLVLRIEQVLWASAPGADVPLVNAPLAGSPTQAELQLEGGIILRGGLPLAPRQRLGDYLESAGPFVPLHSAVMLRSRYGGKPVGAALGDIALSQNKIEAAWETPQTAPDDPSEPAPG
jgi:hypothetical protein